jgi:hypothetical protein
MTPSNEPRLLVRGMQRAQNVHSLRAMQIFMWAKDLPSRSTFKTRLRCPIKAPIPYLRQALQRADIVVAKVPVFLCARATQSAHWKPSTF